jgi:hypothetical protein
MSLMKLLSVSKSFAGGRNEQGRYKMAEQGLLPKFAPMGRTVSLAPKRKSEEPARRQEAKGTPPAALSPLQQQFFRAVEPLAEPVKPVAPSPRAAVCVNANTVPTDWFRLGNKSFVNKPMGRPKPLVQSQPELSLDAVKPVRNDLSESDLQIVPASPGLKPDASKPPHRRWSRPELTGLAWSRLTARFFNSERVRA